MEKIEDVKSKNDIIKTQNSSLATSTSMLGFCFVIVSYLNATKLKHETIIDDVIMISLIAFMINCIVSFLAIQYARFQTQHYVNLASIAYGIGMFILLIIAVLMALNMIT